MKKTVFFAAVSLSIALGAIWGTTPAKPDLRVDTLEATQVSTNAVPLRLTARITVKNYGSGTGAVSFVTRLSYRKSSSAPWLTLWDFPSGAASQGGGATWTKTFDFDTGGTYFFKAEVDVNKSVNESSEGNNIRYLTKSFNAGQPDLAVENLNATLTSVSSSGTWNTRVEFDIANTGTGKAMGSFVNVLKVSKNGGAMAELARYTTSNLDAGQRKHYTKTATFTGITSVRFMVVADDTHAISEKSEANNTAYSQTLRR